MHYCMKKNQNFMLNNNKIYKYLYWSIVFVNYFFHIDFHTDFQRYECFQCFHLHRNPVYGIHSESVCF